MHAVDDDTTITGGKPSIARRVDKVRVEQYAFEISNDAAVSINRRDATRRVCNVYLL